ncbi:hypothetical protein STRDD11_01913 [Streptococcus sp. DD11]|nr:hypothetical protein STRDD11_01913 [Streptococcus sp. DD11]
MTLGLVKYSIFRYDEREMYQTALTGRKEAYETGFTYV